MAKMWAGRTDGNTDKTADDFNSSISFDSRMYRQDITGSMAHASMLGATGIITQKETEQLIDGLGGILDDIETGKLSIRPRLRGYTYVCGAGAYLADRRCGQKTAYRTQP